MKTENLFDISQISDFKEEIIEKLLEIPLAKELKIERIISKGHSTQRGFWYEQETDEMVFLLKGSAILEFENNKIVQLNEGDFLTIPKFEKHKVNNTSTNPECIWLAIHFK